MTRQRYPETFKIEAVNQITERGRPVADIARAIGVSSHSLSAWLRQYGKPADQLLEESALQAELRQVTEERNILKEAAVDSIGQRNNHVKTCSCGGLLNETNI
ncbi:transposase, partial [Aeromonas allosaccharophila]|uniref:transposase n=1 Tax=Aeromonas allosaccharophila TaxID=656 RepID=UPI0039870181